MRTHAYKAVMSAAVSSFLAGISIAAESVCLNIQASQIILTMLLYVTLLTSQRFKKGGKVIHRIGFENMSLSCVIRLPWPSLLSTALEVASALWAALSAAVDRHSHLDPISLLSHQ